MAADRIRSFSATCNRAKPNAAGVLLRRAISMSDVHVDSICENICRSLDAQRILSMATKQPYDTEQHDTVTTSGSCDYFIDDRRNCDRTSSLMAGLKRDLPVDVCVEPTSSGGCTGSSSHRVSEEMPRYDDPDPLGLETELPWMKGCSFEATRRHTRKQRVCNRRLARAVCPELLASRRKFRKTAAKPAKRGEKSSNSTSVESKFARLREEFEKHYADELAFAFGPEAKIFPAPTSRALQARFLDCFRRHGGRDAVRLGYHGTSRNNFKPIFRSGFQIPGRGGVQVANGSAHGVGIYTARLGGACLSHCFARGCGSMLVCGIVDEADKDSMRCRGMPQTDVTEEAVLLRCGRLPRTSHRAMNKPVSVVLTSPQRMGAFHVHRRTAGVLHVGDAQVVFDERRVIPLFQVDRVPTRLYCHNYKATVVEDSAPSSISSANDEEAEPTWLDGNPNHAVDSSAQSGARGPALPAQELTFRRHSARRIRQQMLREERALKGALGA